MKLIAFFRFLNEIAGSCLERLQVFDLPQPKVEVTEHRVEEKTCPCCGRLNRGAFPDDIRGPTQYGERVQALIAYFARQHFIPVDRVCQIFEDLFGIGLSTGTCANLPTVALNDPKNGERKRVRGVWIRLISSVCVEGKLAH